MKRALSAWLLASACVLAGGVTASAQRPPTQAAQEEFVPVRDLPEAEQLPAAPLMIGSYAFIWVATLGYVWFTWRRLGAIERELSQLRRDLGARAAPDR